MSAEFTLEQEAYFYWMNATRGRNMLRRGRSWGQGLRNVQAEIDGLARQTDWPRLRDACRSTRLLEQRHLSAVVEA